MTPKPKSLPLHHVLKYDSYRWLKKTHKIYVIFRLLSKSVQSMLQRVRRKRDPLKLLVGMQTSTVTMENSVEIP